MNSNTLTMEKPGTTPMNRIHIPDAKFIEEQFPEPVMPACPINKVLKGQKAITFMVPPFSSTAG